MPPNKQKIIQKRVKRRERFSRMAKLKHRKQNPVFTAKSEVLAGIEKGKDDSVLIHEYSPGIVVGERNGGIDCEPSMLNKNYISNSVNVHKEGDTKIVQIQLSKNTNQMGPLKVEEVEGLEKRGHSAWAEKFKKFSVIYNNFLAKHEEKFNKGDLDRETLEKYNLYQEKRKELMTTKHVCEMKTRFNTNEDYVSEVVLNSHTISSLEYNVDEFVDKILREGIPRLKNSGNDDGLLMSHMMDNFENIFEKPMEIKLQNESIFRGKHHQIKTGPVKVLISGYFLKNRAELSYLLFFDDIKPMALNTLLYHLPSIKTDSLENKERRAFLERYYDRKYNSRYCGIREIKSEFQDHHENDVDTGISSNMLVPLYNDITDVFNQDETFHNLMFQYYMHQFQNGGY